MNDNLEPQRLLDDPNVVGSLRGDLNMASSAGPLRYDVELGLARFRALAVAPAIPQAGSAGGSASAGLPSPGAASLGVGKVVAGIAGLLVIGGVAWALLSGAPGESPTEPAVAHADRPEADAPLPTSPEALAQASPLTVPAPVPVPVPEVAGSVAAPEPLDPPEPSDDGADATQRESGAAAAPEPRAKSRAADPDTRDFLSEARKVQLAKKTLDADPARTLVLLDEIAREFPRGQLEEERQGLRVLALLATGETDEGQRRAAAYLRRYPRGTLATRVRRALGESP